MKARNGVNEEIICLNKDECIDLYGKLCSGNYEIDFLNKIKLMIPSCDEFDCHEHKIY
jgi:hypothetical protein